MESLEARLLLDGAAPYFDTTFQDRYYINDSTLTIGLDTGDDDAGDTVTLTASSANPDLNVIILQNNPYAVLNFTFSDNTTGSILVQLFQRDSLGAPTASYDAVEHFIALATHNFDSNGDPIPDADPFYTSVVVHRIIDGFMFQTGDAVNGNGTGGSTLGDIEDSFDPLFNFGGPGVLAMANSGPDSSDSQFFITESAYASGDQKYIIFGQMIGSEETFDKLMSQPVHAGPSGEVSAPDDPPILTSVEIIDNHTEDPVVILKPTNGFTGDTSVTFTLTDDSGNTTEQVIDVTAAKDYDVRVEPGVAKSFHVDISGLTDPTITSGLSQATVSLDPLTGLVTVTAPADFSGPFTVTLNDGDTGVQDYFIFAQGAGDPAIVDYMPTTDFSFLCSVQQGNLLYAGKAGGIEIYDISDPEKPVLLGSLDYGVQAGNPTHEPFNVILDMKLQGNTLYVMDTNLGGAGRLASINVSDPHNPSPIDLITTVNRPMSFEISGNTAFVVDRGTSLAAIDISDPANLDPDKYLNRFSTAPAGFTIVRAEDVAISGHYAYLSTILQYSVNNQYYGAIITVDISNPGNMSYAGWSFSGFMPNGDPIFPLGLDIDNGVLYATEGSGSQTDTGADFKYGYSTEYGYGTGWTYGSVSSYSLSSPAAPKYLSGIGLSSNGWQIDVQDGMALVMPDDGTQFIFMDVSDPLHMHVNSVTYNQVAGDGWGLKPSLSSTLAVGPVAGTGTFLFDASSLGDPQWIITRGTLFDENGTAVTISVSGGGNVRVIQDASGHFEEIALVGGTSASKLTIATPSRRTTAVDAIVIEGSAASVTARTTSLLESMTVSGTLGGLTLDDVGDADPDTAPVTIDIHTNSSVTPVSTLAMSITLGDVSDTLLTVRGIPVKSLVVSTWTDVDDDPSNDNITAKRLDKLSAKGDFAAGLDINAGGSTSAVSLGSATLGGGASGAWNITGSTGAIRVTGQADGLEVRATGNIASLTLGAARDSNFLAGFDQTFTYPHAVVAGDFAPSLLSSIGAITISGLKVARNTVPPRFLENTNFSAAHIGKVTLKNVDMADPNLDDPNLSWGLWAAGTGTLSGITSVKTSDTDPANKRDALYNWSWRSTSPTTPDVIHLLVTSGPAPTVAGVSPNAGPLAGGTAVTITGTNLLGATAVYFGNKLVPIVSNTGTQIVVASPEGVAGTVDVTVVTAGGRSATSAADQFTYAAAPTITGVSPSTGSVEGGTAVTITGTNLLGATSVKFGDTSADIVSNTATQIVVTSPAGVEGTVDVTVVTAGGTSSAADQFTYQAAEETGVALSLAPVTSFDFGGTLGVVNVVNVVLTAKAASGVVGAFNLHFTGDMIQIEAPVWNDETGTYVGTIAPTMDIYSENLTGPDGNPYTITGDIVTYSSHFLYPASFFVAMSNPTATITDTTYTPAITCTSPGALYWTNDGVGGTTLIESPTELAHLSNSMSIEAAILPVDRTHQIVIAQIVYRASGSAPILNGNAADENGKETFYTNVSITYVPV
jgi:cyclophilin family peptidyl-prolyl cis-trans isomerase